MLRFIKTKRQMIDKTTINNAHVCSKANQKCHHRKILLVASRSNLSKLQVHWNKDHTSNCCLGLIDPRGSAD